MKVLVVACFLTMSAFSLQVFAQDEQPPVDHPMLTDKVYLGVGAFSPQKSFKIRVDGTLPGEEIDFDQALRVEDSESTGTLFLIWRFGEKWSMQLQGWGTDAKGGAILTEDVEWQDLIFKEGTFARAGVELSVARVVFGREIWTGPNYEVALGVGLHWMEIGAFLEGEVITNMGGTEFQRSDAKAEFPLPNIGGWWTYAWSPKWAMQVRVDWLSASIGDYSGGLLNANIGVGYQITDHLGIAAGYSGFDLDGTVKKRGWRGKVEQQQHGPRLMLTANW